MKMHYYPDTDSLYVEFKREPSVETREVADGLNMDLDAQGNVVGFDIDHARRTARTGHPGDSRATCKGVQGRLTCLPAH
ncbi:MAG: DUF2283 domain-containing protein [Acidobacteriota bacterium]|nr:DUF2283 domain-containing protein [Acidobacteriota bacterium]MDE3265440.1 DUF2283 domain-containing protein [Acidobacteriota bacterium]